ncbi:MAG: FHA domain-containing protein [Fuerstiella sp.]
MIGRESDCQLRPNSELVSRHHCVFTVDDFSVRLRDLGSTNGTSVNGERIRKEVVLQPGDRVIVGSLEFEVTVSDGSVTGSISAASEETVIAGADTLSEMKPIDIPGAGLAETSAAVPVQPEAPAEPAAAEPAPETAAPPAATPDAAVPPPPELPPGGGAGDTTVIAQPMMMPGQTPYQPMMPQHMGYPMYGNYPYPGMPGQMPMYPQQYGYPQGPAGYPQQPQPAAPAEVDEPKATANVSLPDPSETGARPDPPKPAPAEGQSGAAPPQSNQSAAAIIQQHRHRRPGG